MPTLNGLEGVSKKETEFIFESCVSKIQGHLEKGFAVSTAADNGAINVWKDDAGNIRVEAMRFMRSLDKKVLTNYTAMRKWFSEWKKVIQ